MTEPRATMRAIEVDEAWESGRNPSIPRSTQRNAWGRHPLAQCGHLKAGENRFFCVGWPRSWFWSSVPSSVFCCSVSGFGLCLVRAWFPTCFTRQGDDQRTDLWQLPLRLRWVQQYAWRLVTGPWYAIPLVTSSSNTHP